MQKLNIDLDFGVRTPSRRRTEVAPELTDDKFLNMLEKKYDN
jgi:hypothetical protein